MFDKQSFALQQCSEASYIKYYISVRKQKVNNQDLWSQRKKLLLHLEQWISEIHGTCIPKASKPVVHLDCPLQHDEKHEPHLSFKSIPTNADLFCNKSNERIDVIFYNLLVKLENPPGE